VKYFCAEGLTGCFARRLARDRARREGLEQARSYTVIASTAKQPRDAPAERFWIASLRSQ
jgi:hypothetical protein